ncbi:MAG: aminotransferase class I/II-fold pyridoxal phosphate-dependent enzyme, partial [Gammaproteobacteria bacterium]|nr:aminotransferase class I/II-fold pyridoxal phosphate-dependent enzyme [Gammaproteobacteria bacterium]
VDAATNYQLTADMVRHHWSDRSVAVMLASPANPTGTVVTADEMERLIDAVRELGGVLIVDEIYHGLTYGFDSQTVLHSSSEVFVVNSFSKYYCMTGWRMGWLVSPSAYVDTINRLAQNVFISSSTPAQYACLAAFDPVVRQEMERRRQIFCRRRDFLVPALRDLGFKISVVPQGAFYVYADCSAFTDDSYAFALDILANTGVALAPGVDFGCHRANEYVRFSYANDLEKLREGVRRIGKYLSCELSE